MISPFWLAAVMAVILSLANIAAAEYSVEYYPDNTHSTLVPSGGSATYNLANIPLMLSTPATVDVNGSVYEFSGEGLYRIYQDDSLVRQTLRYGGDYWRLAGHLSRLHVHGWRHQNIPSQQWDTMVRDGQALSVTCGYISSYAIAKLQSVGVQARFVHTLTLDQWNTYDNGHSMLEIYDTNERRWILYDVDLGTVLRYNEHRLNLLDATRLYRSGGTATLELLNSCSVIDPQTDYYAVYAGYGAPREEVDAFLAVFNHDAQATHNWYHRVLQVPIIGTYFAANTAEEAARVKSYSPAWASYTWLTPQQFHDRFYAGEPTYIPEPKSIAILMSAGIAGGYWLFTQKMNFKTREKEIFSKGR